MQLQYVSYSNMYFVKWDIPDGEEKVGFRKKLLTFCVSLQDYASAIKQEEIL